MSREGKKEIDRKQQRGREKEARLESKSEPGHRAGCKDSNYPIFLDLLYSCSFKATEKLLASVAFQMGSYAQMCSISKMLHLRQVENFLFLILEHANDSKSNARILAKCLIVDQNSKSLLAFMPKFQTFPKCLSQFSMQRGHHDILDVLSVLCSICVMLSGSVAKRLGLQKSRWLLPLLHGARVRRIKQSTSGAKTKERLEREKKKR